MPASRPALLIDCLDMDEAAAEAGIVRKTLQRYHADGEGPARFPVGRKWWCRREALTEWLLERERRQVEAEQRAANPPASRAPGRPRRPPRGLPQPAPAPRRTRRR
jgi:hypothetical protein